jgi:hypothetical protein
MSSRTNSAMVRGAPGFHLEIIGPILDLVGYEPALGQNSCALRLAAGTKLECHKTLQQCHSEHSEESALGGFLEQQIPRRSTPRNDTVKLTATREVSEIQTDLCLPLR